MFALIIIIILIIIDLDPEDPALIMEETSEITIDLMKRGEVHPEAAAMKTGHQEIRKRGESLDQITELKKEPHNLHLSLMHI